MQSRALSDLMESGRRLIPFVSTQFPNRQMNSFGWSNFEENELIFLTGNCGKSTR
jgi:hypothetical protein